MPLKCPFKVGDLITGSTDDRYGVTNKNSVCKVIDISPNRAEIEVEIVIHNTQRRYLRSRYWVLPEYFVKYEGDPKLGKRARFIKRIESRHLLKKEPV